MKKTDLQNRLSHFYTLDEDISADLYFIYQQGEKFLHYRPALEDTKLKPKLLSDYLDEINRKLLDDEEHKNPYELADVNTPEASDLRSVYFIPSKEVEKASQIFNISEIVDDSALKDFGIETQVNHIWGFLIKIGNTSKSITLFKKNYGVNILKKESTNKLFFGNTGLKLFDKDVINLSKKIDVMLIDDDLIVFERSTFESSFDYVRTMLQKASVNIELINKSKIVDDLEKIQLLMENKRMLRRIVAIDPKNIILKTPVKKISQFAKKYKLNLPLNEDKSRFVIETKKSAEIFIKLLNDDYLQSDLTKNKYDTKGKKKMD